MHVCDFLDNSTQNSHLEMLWLSIAGFMVESFVLWPCTSRAVKHTLQPSNNELPPQMTVFNTDHCNAFIHIFAFWVVHYFATKKNMSCLMKNQQNGVCAQRKL